PSGIGLIPAGFSSSLYSAATPATNRVTQLDTPSPLLDAVAAQIKAELAPLTSAIDQAGTYPGDYLRKLGALGGFGASISPEYGGLGLGLARQIDVTALVGGECGSTAFLVWCQSCSAWYLQHSPNEAVRARYLKPIAQGVLLAGTGMSNAVKHLAGIERIQLNAQRDGADYIVNGTLAWVSNIGPEHVIIVTAAVENEGYVMFAVHGDAVGLRLRDCPEFSGMGGTQTLNMRFKNVRIPADDVLAHPDQFSSYLRRIKPGFVLGQTGMGFGIIEGSLKTIRESNVAHSNVNTYLDDQGGELATELNELRRQARILAKQAQEGDTPLLPVLKLRAQTSELTLKAANSAVLHAGAIGYLMHHPAQRRLREAVFVAIVTPALKHLRKEIHDIEHAHKQHSASEAFARDPAPFRTKAA
ncbi:MAG: acyl-CoA dehydrogenase family protein, partial [Burkholderiaceae bacterium]